MHLSIQSIIVTTALSEKNARKDLIKIFRCTHNINYSAIVLTHIEALRPGRTGSVKSKWSTSKCYPVVGCL